MIAIKIMKNIKIFMSSFFVTVMVLIVIVYTWDIPAPKKTITKVIDINDKIIK